MKNKIIGAVVLALSVSTAAHADVSGLTASFKGGCKAANTTGSCTIAVRATGSDLGSDSVLLQHATTAKGHFKNVSSSPRSLSDSGSASFRFRNVPGFYRVTTSENGNASRDVVSKAISEK